MALRPKVWRVGCVFVLTAEAGGFQYQIMAVMAHTQARASEIYTKGVERRGLAADGVSSLPTLNW